MTRTITILLLCAATTSRAAYLPPRPQSIARTLTGAQIAAVVTNVPPGTSLGIPPSYIRPWRTGAHWHVGDIASYRASAYAYRTALYCCIQSHTAQANWAPEYVPSLWRLIRAPDDPPAGPPLWRQPLGAHDAYAKGDRVTFENAIYESLINANVWSPSAYPSGWKLIK